MASKAQRAIEGLIARGFSPVQAAVLAGNIQQESGFNPEAYNAKEDAYGGIQWRLDRKANLEQYAKATGRKVSDPEAQMDFLVMEMTGAIGNEAKNAAAFLAAQDPVTANKALKKYIRYGDDSEGARLNNALSYGTGGNALTGEPVRVADASFVNPAFGGAEMPGVPEWNGSGYALPPDGAPAPSLGAPAGAPPSGGVSQPVAPSAPAGVSDDDLLNAFLPAGNGAPASSAAVDAGASAAGTVAGAPAAGNADDQLLQAFLPTTPGEGDVAVPPEGLKPGSKEYALWARDQAIAGKRLPQFSDTMEPPPPTELADKILAASASYMDGMPVLGGAWLDAAQKAKAALYGVPLSVIQEQTAAARKANPTTSMVAGAAGTILPLLAASATPLGGRLLGVSGTIPQQVIMGGASNALLAGADSLARGGTLEEARDKALLGGAVGSVAPWLLGTGGNAVNALIGKTAPEIAQLAVLAREKFGIPIGPGQISDSPMIKVADSVVNKMPFSGGTVSNAQQAAAFNRGVAKVFGEDAASITPDVMNRASNRIGDMFEEAAAKTPKIAGDPSFDQKMLDVMTNAQMSLTEQQMKPLMQQFDNIVGKFQQGKGSITGEVYQELTKKGSPLWNAMKSGDPGIRDTAIALRSVLDDALERSATPDVVKLLQTARSQWKAMKTVEDLVEKSTTGDINPALLMGAVRKSYGDMAYGGGGDLAELARIGQQFLKAPPSSGTAERLAVMNMLTKGAGVGGVAATAALNPGAIPMMAAVGIPAAAGYLGVAKGAGALLRSDALANKLIGNSLGRVANPNAITSGNLLLRSGTGAAALGGGNPLVAQ